MVAGARITILGHKIEFMHRKWKNKKRRKSKKKDWVSDDCEASPLAPYAYADCRMKEEVEFLLYYSHC